MADLLLTSDVKTALKISGTEDDTRIAALVTSVSEEVRRLCYPRMIEQATYTDFLDGSGTDVLVLPQRPVVSVTSLWESIDQPRVYGTAQALVVGTGFEVVTKKGWLVKYAGYWYDGPNTVKVVYNAGYSTIPAELVRACIEIIQVKLEKGKNSLYHIGSEQRADGSMSYISRDDITPDAMRIIRRFQPGGFV